ncbi:hypothetical protein NAMH_0012 [Nautilia profundicola AmH]|uniref:Uncharacterized protein n=1 Tax=Nautilia profundicola (strain ATCC BAA-1463 / DSM 18972 / AmH) TaxID=598659 RepID=B9L746_NAUPA|nr:hypothetical protein [Nautilia profundicola]ACM93391.1 hypothetical protein NAMH_0012 [Nautilia profundicola AmH]
MKKSIALLITIFFLFIVLGIIGTILNLFDKYSSKENLYISQNSVILKQSLKTLSKLTEDIKTSKDLQKIFTTFSLSNKEGNFRIIYNITPIFNKIDINAINKKQIYLNDYLINILQYYNIMDPIFFINLIKDTIDKDKTEREGYSEIILKNPNFQNGKIYNYKHFKKILNYYFKITHDRNIFNIPWKKLIFFGNGNNHILECNFLTKDIVKFMGLTIDKPNCQNILTNDNNQTINKYDIIEFTNNNSFWINVNIKYYLNEQNYTIDIVYDIHNKKVISIESHTIY